MKRARRGLSVIYVTVIATVVFGFVSFAVDYGRVQVTKTELQRAADAAARAAVTRTPNINQCLNLAVQYAGYNKADGTSVVLDANQDVEMGLWDKSARTFSVLQGNTRVTADAVRVTARRTVARGNPVQLTFSRVVGWNTCDVTAVSVAYVNYRYFGLVGLNGVKFSGTGNSKLDSYDSESGPYTPASSRANAVIASNGNIDVSGNCQVRGDAHPGIGCTVSIKGGASVTGSTTPLTFVLNFPVIPAGDYATNHDNAFIPSANLKNDVLTVGSGTLTLPGGNYYLSGINVGSNCTLRFTGPVTLWVTGNVSMSGTMLGESSYPPNLRIRHVGNSGSVDIKSQAAFYADIYAPNADLSCSGSADYFGGYVGRTLSFTGQASIHYDEALGAAGIYGEGIQLVR